MVQLVEIQEVCDRCYQDQQQRVDVVETVEVGFGKKRYELDLCADHLAEFQALQAFTEEHGRAVGPKQRPHRPSVTPGESYPCEECNRVFPTPNGRAMHTKATHQRTDLACPECDRPFTGTIGLITHRRSTHGIQMKEQETLALIEDKKRSAADPALNGA